MLRQEPLLLRHPAFVKLFVLFLLILVMWLITFFLGVLLSRPLFGIPVMETLSGIGIPENPEEISLLKFMQVLSQLGAFVLPGLIFAFLVSFSVSEYLGLKKLPGLFSAISVVLLMYLLLPVINELVKINQAMVLPDSLHAIEEWMRTAETRAEELTKAFLNTRTIWGLVINLLIVGVIASVAEELLFRAVLIRVFRSWLGNVHIAVVLSAIIFSAFHLQFFGFLPRFVLGLIFGYLFVWSGSVWLPILAHFINNASAVMVYYLFEQGVVETPAEEFGSVESTVLLWVSIVLSLALIFFVVMNEQTGLRFLKRNR
ncbi:MAG: CPBP family intramembrane metalloprotease [Bacteroidales bacterium]|nr:CPBP family intramembrane metalloprotease [Bacteroidales bacterium]